MGVLEKYKYVNNYGIEVEPPKGYTPSFNLELLPHVDLAYDIIAKEVYGLSECL